MPLPTTLAGRSQSAYYLAYDSFTRADAGSLGNTEPVGPLGGAVVRAWQTGAGSTWAISSNEAVNTPTEGADLVTNGNFANWTGDNPNNWVVPAEDANNYVTQNPAGECQIMSNGGSIYISQAVFTIGTWYAVRLDCTARVSGALRVIDGSGNSAISSVGSVASYVGTFRATHANLIVNRVAACNVTIDNVTAKALTLNTLFSSVEIGTANTDVQAEIDTLVTDTRAGLVLNLDSVAAPANFVIAYHDGTNAKLIKCVGGTYTSVISAATAYGAGQIIRVVKSGTSYSLYYNGVQVGITSTISDAGIVSNTRHGLFSTYSGNQLDNFQCVRV